MLFFVNCASAVFFVNCGMHALAVLHLGREHIFFLRKNKYDAKVSGVLRLSDTAPPSHDQYAF